MTTKKPAAASPDDQDIEVLHEFVKLAKAKLQTGPWDYITGGAETETTLIRNRLALDSLAFRPRVLRNVEGVTTRATFMGRTMRMPVILAPIGSIEDIVEGGAATPSKAAADFHVVHMVSSVAQPGLEEVARSNDNFKLFQLYVRGDATWVDDIVARVIAAGYGGLAITVDLDHYGRRERDLAKRTKAFTKVLNSIFSTHSLSARCWSCQRPGSSGSDKAHQAFRFQANAVITMYAQLLTRLSTGAVNARTPPSNCANRFS